jgi:hypothetical protein
MISYRTFDSEMFDELMRLDIDELISIYYKVQDRLENKSAKGLTELDREKLIDDRDIDYTLLRYYKAVLSLRLDKVKFISDIEALRSERGLDPL